MLKTINTHSAYMVQQQNATTKDATQQTDINPEYRDNEFIEGKDEIYSIAPKEREWLKEQEINNNKKKVTHIK